MLTHTGAHPGPACYRKGGPLTVTDANLFLGRLRAEHFPKIFGEKEDQSLDAAVTRKLFTELTDKINEELPAEADKLTPEAVALGFLKVANESMCRPIRALTEARGHDAAHHDLAVFGGAGGQHACDIASSLSIGRVIIHRYSSILSAYGMALAEVVSEAQDPLSCAFSDASLPLIQKKVDALLERAQASLHEQSIKDNDQVDYEIYLNMRYDGSDTLIMIPKPEGGLDFGTAFIDRHQQEFGFTMPRSVPVEDVRVRARGRSRASQSVTAPAKELLTMQTRTVPKEAAKQQEQVYFEHGGWQTTPILPLSSLDRGDQIQGPAIIIDNTQTLVITPEAKATILQNHVVVDVENISRSGTDEASTGPGIVDPIQLSVFGHRFMGIAEQMGRTLQKTSVSTNIKERLDFSCALFSADGRLVANAPHVPVHLGSMQYAVLWQHEHWKGRLKDGDVLVSNHPVCGGTHLPDITVITPVFEEGKIIFYTASRGHHADIGGISAGSLPPNSTELWQEGAAIESVKLVENGVFNEEAMAEHLLRRPAAYPGCSGARNLSDNLADLRAQVGANQKGINLIRLLTKEYGLQTVMVGYQGRYSLAQDPSCFAYGAQ